MAAVNMYHPQTVSHPGTTLGEKLKELGMSFKEFAIRTMKPERVIVSIVEGNSSITPDMATAFESVTKIPAHFWLNRQRAYDESLARPKHNAQLMAQPMAMYERQSPRRR